MVYWYIALPDRPPMRNLEPLQERGSHRLDGSIWGRSGDDLSRRLFAHNASGLSRT